MWCILKNEPLSPAFMTLIPEASSGGIGLFSQTSQPATISAPTRTSWPGR